MRRIGAAAPPRRARLAERAAAPPAVSEARRRRHSASSPSAAATIATASRASAKLCVCRFKRLRVPSWRIRIRPQRRPLRLWRRAIGDALHSAREKRTRSLVWAGWRVASIEFRQPELPIILSCYFYDTQPSIDVKNSPTLVYLHTRRLVSHHPGWVSRWPHAAIGRRQRNAHRSARGRGGARTHHWRAPCDPGLFRQ